jgi:hypothetical protein
MHEPLINNNNNEAQTCDYVKWGAILAGLTIGISVSALLLLYLPEGDSNDDVNGPPCAINQATLAFNNSHFVANTLTQEVVSNITNMAHFLRTRFNTALDGS